MNWKALARFVEKNNSLLMISLFGIRVGTKLSIIICEWLFNEYSKLFLNQKLRNLTMFIILVTYIFM